MNQENRQKVLEYCSNYDIYPLYFHRYISPKDEFNPEKYTVDDMVKRVLTLSEKYMSYNSNSGEFETSSGRWRSSLDIWRHIIYYYPAIEIFDVMHSLYKIQEECGGQFCNDVERRTFRLKSADIFGSRYWTNDQNRHDYDEYENIIEMPDEYDLFWDEWKEI